MNLPKNKRVDPAETEQHLLEDATFDLPPDDPRRTDNRGGLENVVDAQAPAAPNRGGPDAGATTVDRANSDATLGAAGSGETDEGSLDVSTTGLIAPDSGPAAAGATAGSASGAREPDVEMTTVGVVDDVNAADASTPGADATPKTPVSNADDS